MRLGGTEATLEKFGAASLEAEAAHEEKQDAALSLYPSRSPHPSPSPSPSPNLNPNPNPNPSPSPNPNPHPKQDAALSELRERQASLEQGMGSFMDEMRSELLASEVQGDIGRYGEIIGRYIGRCAPSCSRSRRAPNPNPSPSPNPDPSPNPNPHPHPNPHPDQEGARRELEKEREARITLSS